jgi:hypothetical protein
VNRYTYDNEAADFRRTSVLINIDESIITAALIVEKEDENQVRKWTISNCRSVNDAFSYLMSPNVRDQLEDTTTILFIKFKINDNFSELSSGEIYELTKQCTKKSIVVYFESLSGDSFSIYWKSKDIQSLLAFAAYKDEVVKEDKELTQFVVDFLVNSLKNGHLGKFG